MAMLNDELKEFIESELDFIINNIKSTTRGFYMDYQSFLKLEIKTRLYNRLEDYLREKKIVNINNWQGITYAINAGLATYDNYDYQDAWRLRNKHLFPKSDDYFGDFETEMVRLAMQIGEICQAKLLSASSPEEMSEPMNEANNLISKSVGPAHDDGIDYQYNFNAFITDIQEEYQGKLDAEAILGIRKIADEFHIKIKAKSSEEKAELKEIFASHLSKLLRVVVDQKMESGFKNDYELPKYSNADRFKNL